MSLKVHLWRIRHFETQPSLQWTKVCTVEYLGWISGNTEMAAFNRPGVRFSSLQFHTIAGLSY